METMIQFSNVSKTYGSNETEVLAVKNINLHIAKGEFVVILGPSGAGKSTLLNLLGGMDSPSQGEILIDQETISSYTEKQLTDYRADKVGFVFQFYNLLSTLTAYENVALIKEVAKDGLSPTEVLQNVGLGKHLHHFPSELSGGEQQRVAIARAVCKNPLMLLCDEPTGALDSKTGVRILQLLKEMSTLHHRTVIIVTHNMLLGSIADQVIHMKNGEIQKIDRNQNPLAVSEVNW